MVSFKIVTGRIHTPLSGAYLPPLKLYHLLDLKEALHRFRCPDLIVLGDINVDLDNVQSSRSQRVAYLLMEFGLVDLVSHFIQCQWFSYLKTCAQV